MKVGRFGELSYGIEQIGHVGRLCRQVLGRFQTSNLQQLELERELVLGESKEIDTQLQSAWSYQLGKKNPFPLFLLGELPRHHAYMAHNLFIASHIPTPTRSVLLYTLPDICLKILYKYSVTRCATSPCSCKLQQFFINSQTNSAKIRVTASLPLIYKLFL